MPRLAIMTVGETHSGKSTFAEQLNSALENSIVFDQDWLATFVNTYYPGLVSKTSPTILKPALSNTILSYAIDHSDAHLILCNSNRSREGREVMLGRLADAGFLTVLVYFDLPSSELRSRVQATDRDPSVLRVSADFEEVLERQLDEKEKGEWLPPGAGEAYYYFHLTDSAGIPDTVDKIVMISRGAR